MTTHGFAGWMIWASETDGEEIGPPDPRPGDQWIRGDRWYVWNGRRWKAGNRPRAFRPDLEGNE